LKKPKPVHSSHWQSDDPIGKGHPDAEDEARIREFVGVILKKKESGKAERLALEVLAYNEEMPEEPSGPSRLEVLKSVNLPLKLNTEMCTQCGVCVDSCPVENIALSSYPEFSDRCILCFNCIRSCETNAVTSPTLPMIDPCLRERLQFFNEPQETRFFV
jgi:ferredoxin